MTGVILHWADYVVFIVTILASIGIGIYHACSGDRQRTTGEYLSANRKLRLLPTALSMFMSYISAIFILGTTAEMYTYGSQMILQVVGIQLANCMSAIIFVPLLWPLKITTIYQVSHFVLKVLLCNEKFIGKTSINISVTG